MDRVMKKIQDIKEKIKLKMNIEEDSNKIRRIEEKSPIIVELKSWIRI